MTRGPKEAEPGEIIRYEFGVTTIAAFLAALSPKGVVAIIINERPDREWLFRTLQRRFLKAALRHDPAEARSVVEVVTSFVEEPRGNLMLPLDIRGSAFQQRVWRAVMRVPFGRTSTFAAIAREVDSSMAVRAVGNACSQNPLEFAIPCHRILRSDGSYSGGSAWGDQRQSTMVAREASGCRHSASAVKNGDLYD